MPCTGSRVCLYTHRPWEERDRERMIERDKDRKRETKTEIEGDKRTEKVGEKERKTERASKLGFSPWRNCPERVQKGSPR